MSTSTSLSLRALLKTGIARAGMDSPAREVSGLTPAAQALYVAATAHALPKGSVLFVVPGDAEVERAAADVRFFLAALEGWTDQAADVAVRPLPSHEVDPYRGLAPHPGVTSMRARALHGLASGNARVVVASAAALLPRISGPDRLLQGAVELRPGLDIAPVDLAELLVDGGFSREDPADEHGEFAVRGGILDVFPAGAVRPVRLEFVGDTIESLRYYDPTTQRSIESVDGLTIVPLRDVLSSRAATAGTSADRSATLFDFLSRPDAVRIVVSEPDEVEGQARKIVDQVRASYESLAGAHAPGLEGDVPSPEALVVDWPELATHLAAASTLSRLDVGGPEPDSPNRQIRHVSTQPDPEL